MLKVGTPVTFTALGASRSGVVTKNELGTNKNYVMVLQTSDDAGQIGRQFIRKDQDVFVVYDTPKRVVVPTPPAKSWVSFVERGKPALGVVVGTGEAYTEYERRPAVAVMLGRSAGTIIYPRASELTIVHGWVSFDPEKPQDEARRF